MLLDFLEALFWPFWPEKKEPPKPIEFPRDFNVITSPYLDIHNDYIQLYFAEENGVYFITDGGETISTLEASGLLDDSKGKELLGSLLMDGRLLRSGNKLWWMADRDTFKRVHKDFIYKLREIHRAFEALEAYMQGRKRKEKKGKERK